MAKKRKKKKRFSYKKNKFTNKFLGWWRKNIPTFLQKLGCFSLFLIILFLLFFFFFFRWSNANFSPFKDGQSIIEIRHKQAFFDELYPIAQRLQNEYGVLASVSLGQAALESDFGRSRLASDYNNLFGVKTEVDDPAGADLPTMEYVDGEWIEIVDRFKVYPDWEASMRNHAELIYYGTSWDSEFYDQVINSHTYQDQAKALQESGYATDPNYSDKVIQMIETWNLNQYDQ